MLIVVTKIMVLYWLTCMLHLYVFLYNKIYLIDQTSFKVKMIIVRPSSSSLFQILAEEGFLTLLICAISAHKCSLKGFGFVDDVDLCITSPNHNIHDVASWMQNSLHLWAGLL